MRTTTRPLRNIAVPITSAMPPKNTGNHCSSPNTWSRMISELARYDRNTPNSAVSDNRKAGVPGVASTVRQLAQTLPVDKVGDRRPATFREAG